ncbi:MAG: hypothetical protein IMF08_06770 [Proteobacteria bacterium]|nr:hypothetical protein [Pseudomonadota bacterium]
MAALKSNLPSPIAYVQIDVSGRIPGDTEVREFILGFLDAVPGTVAEDDYTSHPWTGTEVREGKSIEGHPFFDYQGWYADGKD